MTTPYQIYQVASGKPGIFYSLQDHVEHGIPLTSKNYHKVYDGDTECEVTGVYSFLEELFRTFNIGRPTGFTGHSMSTSDIVVLMLENEGARAFYCDTVGFVEVTDRWKNDYIGVA